MALTSRSRRQGTPLVFRSLFADWHARSGALSALPDAPVVADPPAVVDPPVVADSPVVDLPFVDPPVVDLRSRVRRGRARLPLGTAAQSNDVTPGAGNPDGRTTDRWVTAPGVR